MPPESNGALGFEMDIKPLFRAKDRDAMRKAFDLWDYADVVRLAQEILNAVGAGTMPCDGAWPPAQVETFKRWIAGGTLP
jgi:hypothetical protein